MPGNNLLGIFLFLELPGTQHPTLDTRARFPLGYYLIYAYK